MARKYDFRPDSDGKNLLQRLHLTRQQRRSLLKWILYAALLVFVSLIQDVILTHLRVFDASTDLVPCTIFLICVVEGTQSGSVFTLVASLLYLFSVNDLGPYAVIFITFLAIFVTAFRQGYLRKGFAAAYLCTGVALLLYELLLFVFTLFLQKTVPGRFPGFVITAFMTLLVVPILYLPIKSINAIGDDAWKE